MKDESYINGTVEEIVATLVDEHLDDRETLRAVASGLREELGILLGVEQPAPPPFEDLRVTAGDGAFDSLRERLDLDQYVVRVTVEGPHGPIEQDVVVDETTTTDGDGRLILSGWMYRDVEGATEVTVGPRWEDIRAIHIY